MDAPELDGRLAQTADAELAAFDLRAPGADSLATPLIFASPHSGRVYPPSLKARLCPPALRRSEDAYVDALIAPAPRYGVATLTARLARVFMDVNRGPFELDPAMFDDPLPDWACARTARVAAGVGAIARVVSEGEEVYDRKLSFAEARARIEAAHRPYHAALARLIARTRARHGLAVLIDWHSMPSPWPTGDGPHVVLGDRFGCACAGAITAFVESSLAEMGYRVARNAPYAGGYTTEHYGAPKSGVHALQVEIARGLYLDEAALTPGGGFAALAGNVERLIAALSAADWRALSGAVG